MCKCGCWVGCSVNSTYNNTLYSVQVHNAMHSNIPAAHMCISDFHYNVDVLRHKPNQRTYLTTSTPLFLSSIMQGSRSHKVCHIYLDILTTAGLRPNERQIQMCFTFRGHTRDTTHAQTQSQHKRAFRGHK